MNERTQLLVKRDRSFSGEETGSMAESDSKSAIEEADLILCFGCCCASISFYPKLDCFGCSGNVRFIIHDSLRDKQTGIPSASHSSHFIVSRRPVVALT